MRSLLAPARTDLLNNPLNKNSLAAVLSGPREIRTLDLLNAIETRSQLRYGPIVLPSGPGGIRTLDLVSAIDARSQLRYRPVLRAAEFYPTHAKTSRLTGAREYTIGSYALVSRVLTLRITSSLFLK